MKKTKVVEFAVRIALFGGTFDPVHNAHLMIARCALEQANLDRVIFMPTSQSPFKDSPLAQDADRLQMLRLALREEARFELSTYEIEQGKVSYTVDTVDFFSVLHGGAELFWIIGEDQFVQLNEWRSADELIQKVTFLIYPRDNLKKTVDQPVAGSRHQILEAETVSISSTSVRERCKKGLPLTGLVPSSVEAFIHRQGLYKQKIKN